MRRISMLPDKQKVFLLFLVVILCVLFWFAWAYHQFVYRSLVPVKGILTTIKVKQGSPLKAIAKQLHQRKLLHDPLFFIWYGRAHHVDKKLQAGEYAIEPGMSAAQLMHNMLAGKTFIHKIQFIEGWTFEQFLKTLADDKALKHVLIHKDSEQIMKMLKSKYKDPEGLFFPDTYSFTWGDKDFDILKRAYDRMQLVLHQVWQKRAKGLPYKNIYQTLIVASFIQNEAQVPSEREKIAGVIVRRLKKWMHLQIDAAVVYGLHYPYGTKLTKADLKKNTPYNSYLHYGLSPTPISMPGKASIYAALHPDHSKALYYVSKGDGTHVFSDTYAGQQEAVKKYQINRSAFAKTSADKGGRSRGEDLSAKNKKGFNRQKRN